MTEEPNEIKTSKTAEQINALHLANGRKFTASPFRQGISIAVYLYSNEVASFLGYLTQEEFFNVEWWCQLSRTLG